MDKETIDVEAVLAAIARDAALQDAGRSAASDECVRDGCELKEFHVSAGPGADPESLEREIRSAFRQMREGTATVSTTFNDPAKKVDIYEFLSRR